MMGFAGRTSAFDPFAIIPIFVGKKTRDGHSRRLAVPWLIVGLIVIVATAIEGTLGKLSDVRWASDVHAVFSRSVPVTPPRVPLLRDLPDLALFLLIMIGYVLLHRQWQLISECLPRLRESNTLTPSDQPRRNWLTSVFGLDSVIGDPGDRGALDRLEDRLGQVRPRTKLVTVGIVLGGGLVLAILLRSALDQNALRVFVPTRLSPDEREHWLAEARRNWWAGSVHPAGYILYGMITWLGMSLIIAYNLMGIITVCVAIIIYLVIDPKTDWLNKDGRYGWMPVAQVYRSVYWTIALFCVVISILVALLGTKTPLAVIGLVALYALLIPVYTVIPWMFFRDVEKQTREHRLNELTKMLVRVPPTNLERRLAFVAEFARCRDARIRPMSLGRLQFSWFMSVILVPVVLTILQILLPLGLGRLGR
jgi:hypothetical protein